MNQEKQFQFDTMKKFLTMAEEYERCAQAIEEGIKKVILFPLVECEILKYRDNLRKNFQKALFLLAAMSQSISKGILFSEFETEFVDLEHYHQKLLDEFESIIKDVLN